MSSSTLRRTQQRQIREVKTKEDKSEKISNNNKQQKQTICKKKDRSIQHRKEINQTDIHSSTDEMLSTDDDSLTIKKRKYIEDEDDLLHNGNHPVVPSIEQNLTPDSIEATTIPSCDNLPSITHQISSSITMMPADTSSSQNSLKRHTCQYTIPSTNVFHCRNQGTYQCSHCNISFCLQHGLRHQEDLKIEIRDLLTKTQELFDNVQNLNFMDIKTSCLAQLDQWIATIHSKINQIRTELQTTLVHFENKIRERSEQLKFYLRNELEHKVGCILTEQLQEFEINKLQIDKAALDFIRLENLFNSYNNRQLITMINNSENQINLNPPSFVCSDILIDEFHLSENIPEKINDSNPITHETESSSNLTNKEINDHSNVTIISTKMDANIIANKNTEKITNNKNIHVISHLLTDQTDFLTNLFGDHLFESTIDNVLVEEVVSDVNNQQESSRLKTPEPISSSSSPHDSNFSLEKIPSDKKENAKLDLSSQELTDQDMEVVIQYALQNSKLTQPFRILDISSNKIGSKGMHSLCDALEKNSTLTKLNLHANRIHNRGAQYLGDLLQKNSTLMELDISRNQIGHEGIILLSNALKENKTLTVLNLENNLIGHRGAQCLCLALEHNKTIQSLNLNWCSIEEIGVHCLSKVIKTNTSIKVLELAGNQLGETGVLCLVQVLQQNTTLTILNLQLNRIHETGAFYLGDVLRKNKTLRELNLAQNQLGDSGIKHICNALQQNTVLTTLNLSENGIRKLGAQHISHLLLNNKTLTDLDCSSNDIQSEGSIYLRDALRTNKTLINFNLQKNRIGQQGIKSLIIAIKENNTLLTLNLKENNITSTDEIKLNERLMENKRKTD